MAKKTSPDEHQQRAISVDGNSVVSAGAGSGKTTVLANRYLRLLTEGKAGVENILTLTFTRKAAREMHERIYGILLERRDEPRIREQLKLFDKSQISTLDSFCSQIARNWTQGFGVSPDFRIDEVAAGEDAERIALELILERTGDTSLEEFIFVNGFDQVWKKFFVELSRSHLSVAEDLDFDEMRRRQELFLTEELSRKIEELENIIDQICGFDPAASVSVEKVIKAAQGLSGLGVLARDGSLEGIEELLFSFKVVKPRPGKHPDVAGVRELVEPLKNVVADLAGLIASLLSKDVLRGMFEICIEFQRRIIDSRRNSGTLLYQDVVQMAKVCLLENKELRRHYKDRFSHIMIDEFQDNNRLQKDILYLLAERGDREMDGVPDAADLDPGKLFFVGDEKQSIYMFRGADVSVFKELSDELKEYGGQALSLPKNYRTEPALIQFFNTVFERLMAEASLPFEARFERLDHREAELPGGPSIEILYKPEQTGADDTVAHNDDAEAHAVARFIKDAVENAKLEVSDDGVLRPVKYDDFALLMRSTSNQNRYERVFRNMGVPHNVDSIRSLFLEAPVNDIYCLLQLCAYPDDRSAYAAYLRSPFVHVSDDGFVKMMLADKPPFDSELLDVVEVSRVDREKLEAGGRAYNDIAALADHIPLTELVFRIWYRHGYRYALIREPDFHPYLEYYDYLRELARRADSASMSLPEFLDVLRPELGKYERLPDLDILKDGESVGVQILPVHRAKGLEFPVVVFENTGNKGRADDAGNPFYFSDEFGITFNVAGKKKRVNYFYEKGRDEQKRKDEAETKRLIYVALTRAKQHLLISGSHNRNNKKNMAVPLNMILESLGWEPGTDVEICGGLRPYLKVIPAIPQSQLFAVDLGSPSTPKPSPEQMASLFAAASIHDESEFVPEWPASGLETALKSSRKITEKLDSIACDSIISDEELEAAFGTLCHSILEAAYSGRGGTLRVPAVLQYRLTEAELADVTKAAEEIARSFMCSAAAEVTVGAASIEAEVPFLMKYVQNGRKAFIGGVIDILIDRGDEIVLLVFKTDRAIREGEYHLQLSLYHEAVQGWTGKKVRCYLVYLRGNRLIEIPRESLPDLFDLAEELGRGPSPLKS